MQIRTLTLALLMLLLNGVLPANAENDGNIQVIIHLLDYISADYPAAINRGEIISAEEYAEMQEFSQKVKELTAEMTHEVAGRVENDLSKLVALVDKKAPHEEIVAVTGSVKAQIVEATGYKTAPAAWPDLERGKQAYLANCVICHGANGDGNGQLARGMEPAPTNFLDDTLMARLSPFHAFNTIRLGVEGTAMVPFDTLTDEQVWDLAFYIKSMRFDKKEAGDARLKEMPEGISLQEVATLNDRELLVQIGSGPGAGQTLAALRTASPDISQPSPLEIAKKYLRDAMHTYSPENNGLARQNALLAYLEGIEPVEARINANDPKFVVALEQQFFLVRNVIEKKREKAEVQAEIETALAMIGQAEDILHESKITYWLAFLLSFSIIVREGLEAFLIIALIVALIRSSGNRKALVWLHSGWLAALALSFAGWFLSEWVISISGKNREIMEGMVALLAVLVLTSVGVWLHNQSHVKKWKVFIESKVSRMLQKKNMTGLALFSFMVVFREAFESILFLQAINIETAQTDRSAIGVGVLAAFGLIGLVVFFFLKYSGKIPLRQLFRYSSWAITILAIILMGKGIHAIQEAGWVSVTRSPVALRIDWLGLYPTVETLLSQVLLAGLLGLLYYFSNRKLNKPAVVSNAKD